MSTVEVTLLVFGVVIFGTAIGDEKETNPFCKWAYSDTVHFDICQLTLQPGGQMNYYKIQDETFKYDTNEYAEYYFNWGAPVLELPSPMCANLKTGPCVNFDSSADTCSCEHEDVITYPTWFYKEIYKINTETGLFELTECAHLTNANDDYNNPTAKVYWNIWQNTIEPKNPDPTNGLNLVIGNGDFDANIPYEQPIQSGNCNYFVRWNIECADESTMPTGQYMSYDSRIGQYVFTTRSRDGCPIECQVYDNKLCAGNGVCRYDYALDKPRCFCFNGYERYSDCREKNTAITIPQPIIKPYNKDYSHIFQIGDNQNIENAIVFDLTEFHRQKYFSIKDMTQVDGKNFMFIFNLEKNGVYIDPSILPEACQKEMVGLPCVKFAANGIDCDEFADESTIGEGVAFRHRETKTGVECDLLGTEIVWQLYNENDPAKGILLTAKNGAFCEGTGKNKDASILLQCSNKPHAWTSDLPSDAASDIWELDSKDCSFEGWLGTGLACPNNCIKKIDNTQNGFTQYTVCSEHGVCAYDFVTNFVRCLCYEGFKGDDCSEKVTEVDKEWWQFSQEVLFIIIGSLLFILVVVCVIFWTCYRRLSKKIHRIDVNRLIDDNNDIKNVVNINGDIDVYSDDKSQKSNGSMSSNDMIQSPDENEQFIKK